MTKGKQSAGFNPIKALDKKGTAPYISEEAYDRGSFYLRGLITGIQKVLRNKLYTVGGSLYPRGLKSAIFFVYR